MKKLPLFLLTFLCTTSLFAITITWTGAGSNNLWSNVDNWSSGTVPNFQDNVFIPTNSGTIRFNFNNRRANSVNISAGSNLVILNGARLHLIEVTNIPMIVAVGARLTNRGSLFVKNALIQGINNTGIIDNRGLILVDDVDIFGFVNNATGRVFNRVNGRIHIGDTGSTGLSTAFGLSFVNEGTIRFLSGGTGGGFLVGGNVFQNTATGNIIFEEDNSGLLQVFNGNPVNRGSISFEASDTRISCIWIEDEPGTNFFNMSTGEISIKGFFASGLRVGDGTSFSNSGTVEILGDHGTTTKGVDIPGTGIFSNRAIGFLQIEAPIFGITILNAGGVFENEGDLECSDVVIGIDNAGSFFNEGAATIKINDSYQGINIGPNGVFENDAGRISLSDIVAEDIFNQGDMTNGECGVFIGSGFIDNATGNFLNRGWIIYERSGAKHLTTNFPIVNQGIIVDSYSRFTFALQNQKAKVVELKNLQANVPHPNALKLASTVNLVIQGFFTDAQLTTSAGFYNMSSNTYTPNNNAVGLSTLYAQTGVNSASCNEVIRIRVVGGVQAIGNEETLSFTDQQRRSAEKIDPLKLTIYPNPSTNFFTVQLPEKIETNYEIQLINTRGEIIRQLAAATRAITFDLSDHPAGLYMVRLLENGKTVKQERLVLSK